MIITLCGSTRFKEDFLKADQELSLQGHIVLSLGVFSGADNITLNDKQVEMLNKVHRQKMDMSDAIFVINKDGYIGDSTKSEIEYAKSGNKIINYLE